MQELDLEFWLIALATTKKEDINQVAIDVIRCTYYKQGYSQGVRAKYCFKSFKMAFFLRGCGRGQNVPRPLFYEIIADALGLMIA